MWIVFGTQTRTELVEGGLRVERTCDRCDERATFYERRVARSFTLYFVPVFDVNSQRVLACGACGALFRTDEHGAADPLTRSSWSDALGDAGRKASEALGQAADALAPATANASRIAGEAVSSAAEAIAPALRRLFGEPPTKRAPEPEEPVDHVVPEDPEKAALLRRFAELEKKMGR